VLEACRATRLTYHPRFYDEVYGETRDGEHLETDRLNPTKSLFSIQGWSDMIVNGYIYSFKSSGNYGPIEQHVWDSSIS